MMDLKRDILNSSELENSQALRIIYWVLLFGFIPGFYHWAKSNMITTQAVMSGTHICVPYFPNCGDYYFLKGLPHSYDHLIFFGLMFATLGASGFMAWQGRWRASLGILVVPFTFKILYITLLTYKTQVDFEYFHLPPLFVLLFLQNKLMRIRIVIAVTYFLSAVPKFGPAWTEGAYFTSLKDGMPLVPFALIPVATNFAIVFELVAPWFLLSADKKKRFTALGLWTVFHLYTMLIVGWKFPLRCLPLLWAAFATGEFEKFDWRAWRLRAAHVLLVIYIAAGFAPKLMIEDRDYTLRGKKIGLAMMDANRQAVVEGIIEYSSGHIEKKTARSTFASQRWEPYTAWFSLKQKCRRPFVARIRMNMDLSINGGPFYRLVENVNVCDTEYSVLGNNPWIKTPSSGAQITGHPEKNTYN